MPISQEVGVAAALGITKGRPGALGQLWHRRGVPGASRQDPSVKKEVPGRRDAGEDTDRLSFVVNDGVGRLSQFR